MILSESWLEKKMQSTIKRFKSSMIKFFGLMFLIFIVTKVSLPGLMAYKFVFAIALISVQIFMSIFDSDEKITDTVNPSELKF
jgi:uncharacterized membrane protein (DUF4010 family)